MSASEDFKQVRTALGNCDLSPTAKGECDALITRLERNHRRLDRELGALYSWLQFGDKSGGFNWGRIQEAEKCQLKADKISQVADWVHRFGSSDQRTRYFEGALSVWEVVRELKDHAFIALHSWERFHSITPQEVRQTCANDCQCKSNHGSACKVTFESELVHGYSEQEWRMVEEARRRLPDAAVEVNLHWGICGVNQCEGQGCVERKAIHVRRQTGAFVFTRLFAVPENN